MRVLLLALLCSACDPLPSNLGVTVNDMAVDGPQVACAQIQMRPQTDPVSFERGCLLFTHTFTAGEGLGPDFNDRSCASCHAIPTIGGSGDAQHVVHLTGPRFVGGVEQMFPMGTPVRATPSLIGLGFLDDVSDNDVRNGCGGVGHFAESGGSGHVARMGRKLPAVDVRAFSANAAFREMGLSNHGSPFEQSDDGGPDELAVADVIDLATFVRGLVPPARLPLDPRGAGLFGQLGCATCHRPDRLYTDLCVHNLGNAMADPESHAMVATTEWRTAPLIDVQHRPALLHDGRALTVDQAIHAHAGEAAPSGAAFDALSGPDRDAVVRFVLSL